MWDNISFGTYLKNSVIICLVTVLVALLMATTAGYALSRFRFPGSSFFSTSILAINMIPPLLILIPIYLMYIKFNELTGVRLVGTYHGIIALYATWFIPMSIWILRSFFAAIPVEIEEAARIDGCNRFQVFWKIALPLAMPGIIATGIYIFLVAWDELLFATILLPQKEMLTIPLGIKLYIGNHQNRFDLMMAAATIATLPVMMMFFAVQRWFIKGLTAGAVKG
jgi:multiple sugar transport system permease protein